MLFRSNNQDNLYVYIWSGFGVGIGIMIFVLLLIIFRLHKQKESALSHVRLRPTNQNQNNEPDPDSGRLFFGVPIFSYNELHEATNNFNSSNKLGDGGFGSVYYGPLLMSLNLIIPLFLNIRSFSILSQF